MALGLLLERHQSGMRAVALSLLGHGPDADDAVQDAALTGLRRIGDVRDPAAVGPCLRTVVRNACRTRLRSVSYPHPLDGLRLPSTEATPEQALERHALRDRVWGAIEELSRALRMPLLLRHFSTGVTSYEQMAAVCAVPVGTVRSRLSQAPGPRERPERRPAAYRPSPAPCVHDHLPGIELPRRSRVLWVFPAPSRSELPWTSLRTLGALDVPALVVVGRHDVICGVRWSYELNKLIPGSELLVLEDSGHFGHIEEPERFAGAIAAYVAAISA